jgi:hypothetical protein
MELKLFVWHCQLFNDPQSKFGLYALAQDQDQARELILGKIKNQKYREAVSGFFAETNRPPAVYDQPSAFILHLDVPIML